MDFRDILKLALKEYEDEAKRLLEGLTEQERRFMPSPESHHIDFAIWHSIRAEDALLNYGAKESEQVWKKDEWYVKFGIPAADVGGGYTINQVKEMPPLEVANLIQYYDAVRKETLAYVDSVDPGELELRSPFEKFHIQFPGITKGQVLSHIVVETAQHLGQIAYIRGIIRGIE